jgi:hypothetical protein
MDLARKRGGFVVFTSYCRTGVERFTEEKSFYIALPINLGLSKAISGSPNSDQQLQRPTKE